MIAAIVDARGEPVAASQALPDALRKLGGVQTGVPDRPVRTTGLTTTRGAGLEIVRAPVVVRGEAAGTVIVSRSVASIDAAVAAHVGSQRWVFLLMILLAAAVAWLLARSWTRPLGAVTDAMRRMPLESEAPPVVEPAGPPELRELGAAYLGVAAEVRALRSRRDTVASDVAHQLRTPLTTIGLRIGAASRRHRRRGRGRDTTQRQARGPRDHAAAPGGRRPPRATREGAATGLQRSEVDVAQVARERADAWHDLAREQGQCITVDAPLSAPALATTARRRSEPRQPDRQRVGGDAVGIDGRGGRHRGEVT